MVTETPASVNGNGTEGAKAAEGASAVPNNDASDPCTSGAPDPNDAPFSADVTTGVAAAVAATLKTFPRAVVDQVNVARAIYRDAPELPKANLFAGMSSPAEIAPASRIRRHVARRVQLVNARTPMSPR